MSTPSGQALYKKKAGIITVSDNLTAVTWTPNPGSGGAALTISIDSVTNLQQTPDSSPKVMLKIIVKGPTEGAEPVNHLFNFTSADAARAEANAVKDLLSRLLANARSSSQPAGAGTPTASNGQANGANGGAGSAAMSFASTVNSKPSSSSRWVDDSQLKLDIELQHSLMKADRTLNQTYMEARATKPESISDAAFNAMFWSSRTNLLRAHMIETSQRKGVYNVLSTVKPLMVDGNLKLNISVEQVQLIFAQHPLVKRIYNENVPKISEADFWSRFFLSKLSKRLRGEKVDGKDSDDPLFDHHSVSENSLQGEQAIFRQQRLPNMLDMQGNDENQGGFKGGNMPDQHMRSEPKSSVGRVLNSMSEKMLAHVTPADPDPDVVAASGGPSIDEQTLRELSLRDLRGSEEPERVVLKVNEQARFFSQNATAAAPSADAKAYERQVPSRVLSDVRADLAALKGGGGTDLHAAIGVNDASDSDEEVPGGKKKAPQVGSRDARSAAQAHIWAGLAKSRAESKGNSAEDDATPMGLSADLTNKVLITNATTNEFLKQFWSAFLSGDPDRAGELAYHIEALRRSAARVEAVAAEAEEIRQKVVAARKKEIFAHFQRTQKKLKWNENKVGGGRRAVMALLGPTAEALKIAQGRYQEALAAEGIRPSTEES